MSKLLPNQIYAGLFEILKNDRMYYYSKVGESYCHLSEQGKEEVIKWIELMGPKMIKLEQETLDKRAKELVIEELKR